MRTVKLILLGMAFATFLAFVMFNWSDVEISLGPWSLLIKKPALVLLAFLAGFVPTYMLHVTSRTNLRRKLARAEKSIAEALHERGHPAAIEPTSDPRPELP